MTLHAIQKVLTTTDFSTYEIREGYKVENGDGEVNELALLGLTTIIGNLIQEEGALIDEILNNAVFSHVLRGSNNRNLDQLVPTHSFFQRVEEALEKQAGKTTEKLIQDGTISENDRETCKRNILIGLNNLTRTRLELISTRKIIRTKLNEVLPNELTDESEFFLTPHEIRERFQEVKTMVDNREIEKDNAIYQLLDILKIIDFENTSMDKISEYAIESRRRLIKARRIFTDLIKEAKQLILECKKQGKMEGQELNLPELNPLIPNYEIYDLLEGLFTGRINGVELTPREFNDLQSILILTYALFKIKIHPIMKDAIKVEQEYKAKIDTLLKNVGKKNGEHTVYYYENGEFIALCKSQNDRISTLEITNEEGEKTEVDVKFTGWDIKEDESIAYKIYTSNKPNLEIESMTDILRGRFVIWNTTMKDIQKKQEQIQALAEKIGKTIGLEHHYTTRKNLKPGQYCLEQFDERDVFPKFVLLGISYEGVPFEIQLITQDTYEFEEAVNSPLNHDEYKKGSRLELIKRLIPNSVSENTHSAINIYLKEHHKKREEAITAMNNIRNQLSLETET